MVSARSARLCARSGGGRRHLMGYGLGRGRKTGIVNDNTWGLPHLVRTRCFVNYNTWGLTHLLRTRCVVISNSWGLAWSRTFNEDHICCKLQHLGSHAFSEDQMCCKLQHLGSHTFSDGSVF